MNLTLSPTPSNVTTGNPPQPKRFTLAEYAHLTELGFFNAKPRMELIRGELIEMASKGAAHVVCCRKLIQQLPDLLVGQALVQCQDPIILPSASEPEPDFSLIDLVVGDEKAIASQVLLVIEVSDSSLDYDRHTKSPLYAEAMIPHYWIFNVLDRQLECFSQPQENAAGIWAYGLQQIVLPTGTIDLPHPLVGTIDLSQCFS
jgi:Uma2 family endonuclease